MVSLLFLPFVIGSVLGGLFGGVMGLRWNNARLGAVTGTLGGALGVIPFGVLNVAVWAPLFQNEMGMGGFIPVPGPGELASMLVCVALTGALVSLLCLAVWGNAPTPRSEADETKSDAP
jgi:hypothetical protein